MVKICITYDNKLSSGLRRLVIFTVRGASLYLFCLQFQEHDVNTEEPETFWKQNYAKIHVSETIVE